MTRDELRTWAEAHPEMPQARMVLELLAENAGLRDRWWAPASPPGVPAHLPDDGATLRAVFGPPPAAKPPEES